MRGPLTTRIGIYLPSLRGGGAERSMVALANGFSSEGHMVDVVLAKAEGPYLNEVGEAVRIIDLNAGRVLTSLPGLVSYLRHERPAALLSAMNHANVVAVVARLLSQVPTRLVVSVRANFSVSQANSTTVRGRAIGHFIRWAYPRVDRVVAVSTGVAEDLAAAISMPREQIHVIYNPVVTRGMLQQSWAQVDHPWFAPGTPPVVLAVGRLVPPKDFPVLLRAFRRFREEHDARLMILGEGELRLELERLTRRLGVEKDVELLGFVSNPYAFMRHAALFVLSSEREGLPGALIQAMACGTPVVATDCPSGPAEILENGKWGRLVPVGDVGALAQAMADTLDQPEHPDVAARAASFGADQAVAAYLQLLLGGRLGDS